MLTFMGATHSSVQMMEVKIYKELRNQANRVTNCETANIDKTVTAGLQQLRAIEAIEERMPLTDLPAPLY